MFSARSDFDEQLPPNHEWERTKQGRVRVTHRVPDLQCRFTFYRSHSPHIDACGFDSYSLECKDCGARLAGIFDPANEKLLLSELEG